MNDTIESATSAFITSADIPPLPEDLVTSGELATVSGEIVNQIPSLDGYATEEYVTEHTSAFITSADLPDVSDMATQTWVGEQGYLTSIPSEYVTDTELESELSGKADTSAIPDVSNFVTQEDIDASVSGKMDATESSAFYPMATNPSGYLVSSDLNGYATETYVQSQVSGKADTSAIPSLDGYATQSWVSGQGYLTEVPSEYITDSELSTALNGYATEQYVQDETSAFITSADLPSTEEVQFEELDLSSFVDSAYVSDYVASQTSGKQDTLTFTYDSSDKISAINGSALAGGGSSGPTYSAGTGIDITSDVISVNSAVAMKSDLPSEEEVQFEELDLSGYATESYVDSAVSGKQDTLTFGYDSSDKINAINGSAIAGGGGGGGSYTAGEFIDITNDVISVNSGDVSNLIPGSGILITQSSAGTQVSLDVSAGPGVSLSVQDGTMFISRAPDELLWSGTSANSFTLSEPSMNFERLGIKLRSYQSPDYYSYCEALTNSAGFHFEFENTVPNATRSCQYAGYRYTTTDDLTYTFASGNRFYFGGGGTGTDSTNNLTGSSLKDAGYPVEIYGINRKVVGIGDN